MVRIDENWYRECNWYHIYPIGLCGVSRYNSDDIITENKIEELISIEWIEHLKSLSIGAVYIGPIFESVSHGYDTTDLFSVDKRLGNLNSFRKLVKTYHSYGIKIVLDAVFNHVGRNFFAFNDIKINGKNSIYTGWFRDLDFTKNSPKGDNFTYRPWEGYYELVTLNTENEEVRKYLYDAVTFWYDEFEIDGLRLDAADCIPIEFWKDFREFCKSKFGERFVLIAEIIHGDSKLWVKPDPLKKVYQDMKQPFDGITNYPLWKAIWSAHNEKNLYEFSHTISRQYDVFKGGWLYNFIDNHDVTRIASQVQKEEYLNTIIILLFTIQGSPSTYYGSEFKFKGVKKTGKQADFPLRPKFSLEDLKKYTLNTQDGFFYLLKFLSFLRKHPIIGQILVYGDYIHLENNKTFLAFKRQFQDQFLLIAINIDSSKVENYEVNWDGPDGIWKDLLHPQNMYSSNNGKIIISIQPNWAVIISSNIIDLNYKKFCMNKEINSLNYIPIYEISDSEYIDAHSNIYSDNNLTEGKFSTPKLYLSLNSTIEKLDFNEVIDINQQKNDSSSLKTEILTNTNNNYTREWLFNDAILYITFNDLTNKNLILDKLVNYIINHKFQIVAIEYFETNQSSIIEANILKFVDLIKLNDSNLKVILHSNKLIKEEMFDGYIANYGVLNKIKKPLNKIFISENISIENFSFDASINCELQKALWSCFADDNMFEIGHNLQRQFDEEYGIFKERLLINTSSLKLNIQKRVDNFHQTILYLIVIFTIPGIPLILLKEIEIEDEENEKKYFENSNINKINDLDKSNISEIQSVLYKLREIRKNNDLIFKKNYFKTYHISHSELVYSRHLKEKEELILICINSSEYEKKITISQIPKNYNSLVYLLKTNENYCKAELINFTINIELPKLSGIILKLSNKI